MNAVSFLIENKRSVSENWLIGLTLGGYAAPSIALYCFGGGHWISSNFEAVDSPPGQLQVFELLIPGLFVGLLDFVQIHSEVLFRHKANDRITRASVWLNAAAIVSFLALIPLNSMPWRAARYLQTVAILGTAISFSFGILIGVLHVVWIVIVATARRRPRGPLVDG